MKTIWSLCVLCLAGALSGARAGPVRKPGRAEGSAAPQEEVNVLMFGVIQFSESLKYVYETTEAKISKISQALSGHEGTLQKLGRQTEEAAEVEKQMKEVIQLLQDQMAEQRAQTRMAKERLAGVEQEESLIKTKVKRLERFLDKSVPPTVKELQERAEEHSDVLRGLKLLIQFHRENLDTQTDQLSKLLQMTENMIQKDA